MVLINIIGIDEHGKRFDQELGPLVVGKVLPAFGREHHAFQKPLTHCSMSTLPPSLKNFGLHLAPMPPGFQALW